MASAGTHVVCTIAAANYFNKAEILFQSVRKHMPDAVTVLIVLEENIPEAGLDLADILVLAHELEIEDFDQFLFRYDILEASTAIKPKALLYLFEHMPDARLVTYLDPDMLLLGPIEADLDAAMAGDASVLLTPHHLHDEPSDYGVTRNMLRTLQHGTFNLGFISLRRCAESIDLLRWWHGKLAAFGFNDLSRGLFVDQKWMDIAPGLFPCIRIFRHSGYNVANWNVARRELSGSAAGAAITGSGEPLRLLHFSSIDTGKDLWHLHGQVAHDHLFLKLRHVYKKSLAAARCSALKYTPWSYQSFDSAEPIAKLARQTYARNPELQRDYPNPFAQSNEALISRGY